MTLEEAMKMICDHRAKVKRTKDDWHDGYYDGLTAALMMLSEDEPADTDKPIWEAKDKMTLKELARELRKIFRFKYLTMHRNGVELFLRMYAKEPSYFKTYSVWGEADAVFFPIAVSEDLRVDLDLSEYRDADGIIDYSKCIVEVE